MAPLIIILLVYPIVINIIGFIVSAIHYHSKRLKDFDISVILVCLFGGALGIMISTLFFEKEIVKDNLMSRVFLAVCLVIQLSIVFWIIGLGLNSNLFVLIILFPYLVIINIITFIVFGIDKKRAEEEKWRLKNKLLLGLAFIGGTVGALAAMRVFHHKTFKNYYTWGIPLMMLMHLVLFLLVF